MEDKEFSAEEIVQGWEKTAKNYQPGEMSPADKALFIKAIAAEEAAKVTPFVLGGEFPV